ncbi:MAG: SCO family protein [Aeropyrum sp.]|nr:SCO family protein [Aeropyrum sp.]MCE4615815.1 SCO family protein [Aeropyrum sp.]
MSELDRILSSISPFKWALVASFMVIILGLSVNIYTAMTGFYPKADIGVESEYATVFKVDQRVFPIKVDSTEGEVAVPIQGKINIIVPQYVRCPDICHYETLMMKGLMAELAKRGELDRVVFVTVEVDPWRGTLEEARAYIEESLEGFGLDPQWIWVGGDVEKLNTLYKQFGLIVQRDKETGLIVHTAGFYIVDEYGRLMYYVRVEDKGWERPDAVVQVLLKVLDEVLKS